MCSIRRPQAVRKTIDCLFVFSYGVGETRRVMDERPPSQVAARRLLLVLFFFSPPRLPCFQQQSWSVECGRTLTSTSCFLDWAAGWLRGRELQGAGGGWRRASEVPVQTAATISVIMACVRDCVPVLAATYWLPKYWDLVGLFEG